MNEGSNKHLDIRKYPNRRYYDATRSRHLTLEEIRSLIREGNDIRVTDSKTGADITAQVLTQIVLEMETAKIDSFPVALLVQMIRTNDHLVKDFVEKYFNQAFGAYLEYQKQLEHRMREIQKTAGAFAPFAAWPEGMMNPFMPDVTPSGSPTPSSRPINENAQDMRTIITELQQQVAGLKEQIDRSRRKSKKR